MSELTVVDVEKHNEKMLDPNYVKAFHNTSFESGRKLTLFVEVKDRVQSQVLFNWLYSKNEDGSGLLIAGCELEKINWGKEYPKHEIRDMLNRFLDSIPD